MTSTSAYTLLLTLAVCVVLTATRRRWLNCSCVGAYLVSYLVMDYVGLVAVALGYQYETREVPYVSDSIMMRAVSISNLGLFSVLAGIGIFDLVFGGTRVHANGCILPVSRRSEIGMRIGRLALLSFVYVAMFLTFAHSNLLQAFALATSGDASSLYEYRLTTGDEDISAMVQVSYNLLPYVAFCGMLATMSVWRHWNWFFIATFVFACLGKLILIHKEPFLVFVLQCGLALVILWKSPHDARKKARVFRSPLRIAGVLAIAVALLIGLFWVTHDLSDLGNAKDQVTYASTMAFERVFGRLPHGYLYIADVVPEVFPHYGFNNSSLWARMMGHDYIAINKELYLRAHPRAMTGSISADALISYYGGFGFRGLVVLGAFQGMLLAGIDNWISRQRPTLGWFATLCFMMSFSFYLTETTLFGAMLGFGGAIFILHGLLINTRGRASRSAAPMGRQTLKYPRTTRIAVARSFPESAGPTGRAAPRPSAAADSRRN